MAKSEVGKTSNILDRNSENIRLRNSYPEKYSFQDLNKYSNKINSSSNLKDILTAFREEVKNLVFFHDAEIFFINDQTSNCYPLNVGCSEGIASFVNHNLSAGILDWLGETANHKIIPFNFYNSPAKGPNCLFLPIYSNGKFRGVLFAFTSFIELDEFSIELITLKTLLNLTLTRVQYELSQSELNGAYSELQTLQSKLENDFKLATLGELTLRTVEEISSPIQVILSSSEMIKEEYPELEDEINQMIKNKVYEIKKVLERLAKFTNSDNSRKKINPCAVNEIILDFHDLIEPALKSEHCECLLDLEENIPSILSNKDYLNQILINGFSLVNPLSEVGGGIIVQSRYHGKNIVIKLLFTKSMETVGFEEGNIAVNILKRLMEKHEGEFSMKCEESSGTSLVFTFPLIRKIRS